MKIKIWTTYNVGYLPTSRCRKLRYKEQEEYIEVEVKEISKKELEPAFDTGVIIYSYNNGLWEEITENHIHCPNPDKPMTALEALVYSGITYSTYFGKRDYNNISDESKSEKREDVIARAERDMSNYLVVDGVLYTAASEPMYCICTFGLGHNHAGIGTSLSIVDYYNPNISKERYFNALEYEKALDEALKIASGRGDTKSIEYIKNRQRIKVFDNKYVTRNPKVECEGGNKFIEEIEAVIEGTDSITEAGLLTMVLTDNHLREISAEKNKSAEANS